MTEMPDAWLPQQAVFAAEQSVLGVAIGSTEGADAVGELVTLKDFCRPAHQLIYAAVQRILQSGQPVSPVTVLAELTRARDLEVAGGGNYLHDLLRAAETWALEPNARLVGEDAIRRRMLEAAHKIAQLAAQPGFTAKADSERARVFLEESLATESSEQPQSPTDLFDDAVRRMESPDRMDGALTLPWGDLGDLVPFLRPGQLVTVGARPGAGKSVTAADLTRHVGLRLRQQVVLFTLEMDRTEVMERIIAAETSVSLTRIQSGDLDRDDWDRVAKAREAFDYGTFLIDDTPGIGLAHVGSQLRAMRRREPAAIVIVDYLQLMKHPAESREREVAALAAGLKGIAREFRIPVVMLAQLNRGPESRQDRRPTKSDFRESGAVENESDIVLLIHRPDMHDPDSKRPGEADLIVDKNRSGPTGARALLFQGHYARFTSLVKPWTPTSVVENQ